MLAANCLAEGIFLYTGNTMYDFRGYTDLSIVSANVDPGQSASLSDAVLQASVSPADPIPASTPEPGELVMLAGAFGCFLVLTALRRVLDKGP